ncbi:hypothetical protein IAI10_16130 [Clostridium sp. 19966]|uniref:hypothetical protein n=1 Tax=Clostridium sp. 19966 TaxID=2768166 RepID=UPI0028DE90CA|nr:hypothetical protein [Clostridium sp. 19966]MDT8718195.1 hypothetical protein [Clostridium sp. 19966]
MELKFEEWKQKGNYSEEYINNISELMSWGIDIGMAQSIIERVRDKKNILIVGAVASGKTKLLNLLLNITDKNERFRYLYNSSGDKYNDYAMHVEHQNRIEYHINMVNEEYHRIKKEISQNSQKFWEKPDFYVIDDVYQDDLIKIVKQLKESYSKGTISTCFLRNKGDLQFIDMYLKNYFDIIIVVESYKKIEGIFSIPKNEIEEKNIPLL